MVCVGGWRGGARPAVGSSAHRVFVRARCTILSRHGSRTPHSKHPQMSSHRWSARRVSRVKEPSTTAEVCHGDFRSVAARGQGATASMLWNIGSRCTVYSDRARLCREILRRVVVLTARLSL